MMPEQEQQILLQIVETWRPSEWPEYRGFRCANCQEYKNQAWYHWVHAGGYRLPIHMCDDKCEPDFRSGHIQIDESKIAQVDRVTFGLGYQYSDEAKKRFGEIVTSWPKEKEPELKAYSCDECSNDLEIDQNDGMRKGYHVWWKMDDGKTLAELHFDRDCGHKLGIKSKQEVEGQAF